MTKEEQLWDACEDGELDEVKRLVDEGVDVESTGVYGYTPLMIAADYGRVDTIRFLIDRGANVDMRNGYGGGTTALHYAAIEGHDDGWTALGHAAICGKDAAVRLLIERGANLHMKTNNGYTPLDYAKEENESSTAAIIEAAMQSIKVIYTSSQDLQQKRFNRYNITFKDFSNNIIIISGNNIPNGFEFEEHPVITLQHIQQCLDQLPRTDNEDNISPNNIHDILSQIHPTIATRLQYWGLNVLHLIAYLPKVLSNNIHEVVSSMVSKCPQATTSVDIDGMTPLHHATINLSQNKTSQECHDVLLARSSPIVVHKAIEAGMGWEYLYPIVMAKLNALTMEDEESGLVPFMLAAMKCNDNHVDGVLGSLSVVYELLCLKPDAMKEYDVSIMMKKRILDGRTTTTSTTTESSDQDIKRAKGA